MMKRALAILSLAGRAGGAVSLRGEGVEEVGERIERFPPERRTVDRRVLLANFHRADGSAGEEETLVATRVVEEYDGGVDEVSDEDGDALEYEDLVANEEPLDLESPGWIPNPWASDRRGDRRRTSSACDEGEHEMKLLCKTDNNAYQFSWQNVDERTGRVLARGPRYGTLYANGKLYSGRWCLPAGHYVFRLQDSGGDGNCVGGDAGCGFCKVWTDGIRAGQVFQDRSAWKQKDVRFAVGQDWCAKVRDLMEIPRGTCALPDGGEGYKVSVRTAVDKFGKETSWKIERDGVRVMKMAAIVPANGQKVVEDCLPPGRYEWTIDDFDGICCRHGKGGYTVSVDGQKLFDGGSFITSESHTFQLGFDWISTMDERDCEWWWAHDKRRRDWHTRCYDGFYCDKPYRHLRWSPKLAYDAKDYAERLLDTCLEVGIKHDKTDQGENLAKNRGTGTWGGLYPADKVTKRFVDNEEFWGWNGNAHLTQAMWYPSRYMGCGESVKSIGGVGGRRLCRMQVCRFAKAGNCMMGSYQSDVGNNWMTPMMADDSPCGPMCPPEDGCYP